MNNKVLLITGGSGTLGSVIVREMAQQGATVYILDRNIEVAEQKAAQLRTEGLKVYAQYTDVLDETTVNEAITSIHSKEGKIDILINGAGGNMAGANIGPDQYISDLSVSDFRKVLDLNLLGTVIPTKAVAVLMGQQGFGNIINISSMSAILPLTRVVGYSAAKAAVDNFTRSMAIELINKYSPKIRVNAIAPGFLVADQNRALLLNKDGTLTDRGKTIISQTPMKRFGEPEELISTLMWLCDDRSSFITGIIVPIDGGFSAFSGV